MPHIATVTAFELEMGDELGEGEVICRIDGFTRQSIERAGEPDWSRVATRDISVLLKPQQIVWRMHPEIGPFQDYKQHDGGHWRTFAPDESLRVLRDRIQWPLDRWRPMGCELLNGELAGDFNFPIIDPPKEATWIRASG